MSFSRDTLEFSRLLDLVARNAQTPMGHERISLLQPISSRTELDDALTAVAETIALNEEKQVSWSFSGLGDPSEPLAVLKIRNATLDPNSLLEIARVCTQALMARAALQSEKEFAPTVWRSVEGLPPTLMAAIGR